MDAQTEEQSIVYNTILGIVKSKQGTVDPCMARIGEIRDIVGFDPIECLRELYRQGVLRVSVDVNKNPMFQIKNNH